MRTVLFAALLAAFSLGAMTTPAFTQESCKSKAIGKDGKPLAGAALNSFMAKCTKDACEPNAIDKNGKPLAGAAKSSFMKKCQGTA